MPGSKGREFPHDITEIDGADSLCESNGIIALSERTAAGLFGAAKTLYSCSGATLAIQAMLTILKTTVHGKNKKSRISAFRYAHSSFVSASALLDFDVDWIYPDEFLSAELNPCEVKAAIKPETAAVFVNSIDYYGGMFGSDALKSVADICKQAEIPLLVDNAHGAYLALTDNDHPLKSGAAMSADSAHKTLPALTGAAYLHIGELKYAVNAKAATMLFGTSSPSYLILESLDLCNKHIAKLKAMDVVKAFGLVFGLKRTFERAGFSLRKSDLLRITINARNYGYTGNELAAEFRKNKVECEYADDNYLVLLFSTITGRAEIKAVEAALCKIARKEPLSASNYPVLKPERVMSVRDALFTPDKECVLKKPEDSIGNICAQIVAPCPPGTPLVMPGELIGEGEAALLLRFGVKNIRVINN